MQEEEKESQQSKNMEWYPRENQKEEIVFSS
jgi:hypothetical protein